MLKTTRVSDLSGADQQVEEVAFALAGQSFTIDLTAKERQEFLKSFERYTAVASPAESVKSAGKAKTEKSGPTQAQLMREWAKANDVALPAKGVVPKEVRDLYRAAMAKESGNALKEEAKGAAQQEPATPAPTKQAPAKAAPVKATASRNAGASK